MNTKEGKEHKKQILAYMEKRPTATSGEVARLFGVTAKYIKQLRCDFFCSPNTKSVEINRPHKGVTAKDVKFNAVEMLAYCKPWRSLDIVEDKNEA